MLIKSKREIKRVHVALQLKLAESELPRFSVSRRWLTAVMSSSLQTDLCQKPFLWQRIWGSSLVRDIVLYDCRIAPLHLQESDSCHRSYYVIIMSLLTCITFCQVKEKYLSLSLLLLQCIPRYCILQNQCSMNTQLDLQWWLFTWATRKTLHIPVICFCIKLLSDFNDAYFIIYLKVYPSPLGCAACFIIVYHLHQSVWL